MDSPFDAKSFEKKLDLVVKNENLFLEAVTHRSYLNEHRQVDWSHSERLEYLGDAVLELVVTENLFSAFPGKPEGELTSLRAALVNGDMLAQIGRKIGIENFLLLSKGEAKDKESRARGYLIANCMEAIIGALHLDQGYEAAKKFIEKNVLIHIQEVVDAKLYADPKSLFQEKAQEKMGLTPTYRVLRETGPDHDRHFVAGIFLGDELVAEGEGPSKQEAQRLAAKNGLEKKGW